VGGGGRGRRTQGRQTHGEITPSPLFPHPTFAQTSMQDGGSTRYDGERPNLVGHVPIFAALKTANAAISRTVIVCLTNTSSMFHRTVA
jgi:hypothetical protein